MAPPSLPPWPVPPPRHGRVLLRDVRTADVAMARALSTDPYVPQAGTLPANASAEEALAWVRRQRRRHTEGTGFSFTVVDAGTGAAVGHCGLWLRDLPRGTAGYSIAPVARGQGLAADALRALTDFAWTVPGLDRIELDIEPWNVASLRTAERAGYLRDASTVRTIDGRPRDVVRYAAARPCGR